VLTRFAHRTYVPRVAWGKAAEVLGELAEGDPIIVEGKLRWVKRGKSGVVEYGLVGPSRTACWSRGNPMRTPISLTSSTSKTIIGANGQLYTTVTLAYCRRCSNSHWGSSRRHAADGAEISSCLDCARPSPETLPVPMIAMNPPVQAVMIDTARSKRQEARSGFVVAHGFEGEIDLEDVPKYGPLLTRQDVHELCARVRELLRQRDELQEEVAHLRETLGMFAALRDLMHDDPPSLAHVASNGHIALRRVDGNGEGAITLPVMAGDPDDGLDNRPHDDQGAEDLEATAPDNTIGDGPSVEATNPVDTPAADGDSDALQAEEDAGAISLMESISDRAFAAILRADDPNVDYVQADTVEAAEDASVSQARHPGRRPTTPWLPSRPPVRTPPVRRSRPRERRRCPKR